MKYLKLANIGNRRLPFFLATEEWAARNLPAAEYFFCWQVQPTVICGRHQDMMAEVNMDYCRAHGIDVVRRKSGGGCVYADMDNFMFSYICPGDEITSTFGHYTTLISDMLNSMGLEAKATGRNDILIGEKKVSGNAFYHLPGRSIVHGTMLYDFNPDVMAGALTPSKAKLKGKGVKSVPSRVTGLRQAGLSMSKSDFRDCAIKTLTDAVYEISESEIREIEEIEKTYYDPIFLYGKSVGKEVGKSDFICRRKRIEDVGDFEILVRPDSLNNIESLSIGGDFFILGDPERYICSRLVGRPYRRQDISAALETVDTRKIIPGLDSESLINMIID